MVRHLRPSLAILRPSQKPRFPGQGAGRSGKRWIGAVGAGPGGAVGAGEGAAGAGAGAGEGALGAGGGGAAPGGGGAGGSGALGWTRTGSVRPGGRSQSSTVCTVCTHLPFRETTTVDTSSARPG